MFPSKRLLLPFSVYMDFSHPILFFSSKIFPARLLILVILQLPRSLSVCLYFAMSHAIYTPVLSVSLFGGV